MHLYIAVPCKTPNCGTAHMLMYLGEKGKVLERVEYWIPHPLELECPTCGRSYNYSGSEKDFFQAEFPQPPPPEYSNKLGRHPDQP
jgi:hypothetical protein